MVSARSLTAEAGLVLLVAAAPVAAANPVGTEFQVNSYTLNHQRYAAVAIDNDGDFVVVWESSNAQDGSGDGVFAQRFSSSGVRIANEFQVNSSTDSSQRSAVVASDADGDFVIVWEGEYEGKKYEDKGEIVEIKPARRLKVTHFSPLSGQEDVPENYRTLTYELESAGPVTRVALSQDNNPTAEAAEHSKANWEKMLSGLKEVVETSE